MVHQIGAAEPVKFALDGKEYRLRFTLKALKALDQLHEIRVMKGGADMIEAVRDPAKLALILYHGLMANHPDISLEWVEGNFDSGNLMELAPVIAQAIAGRPVALPNELTPGKVNGVGSPSGLSDDTISGSVS